MVGKHCPRCGAKMRIAKNAEIGKPVTKLQGPYWAVVTTPVTVRLYHVCDHCGYSDHDDDKRRSHPSLTQAKPSSRS